MQGLLRKLLAMLKHNTNLAALATPDPFQQAGLDLRLSVGRSREWPLVVGADGTAAWQNRCLWGARGHVRISKG